jgi:hypothetical protein
MKNLFPTSKNIIPLTPEERNQLRDLIKKIKGRVFFQEKNVETQKILQQVKTFPLPK